MKIAIVTGASSGMGEQFVYQLDADKRYDEIWVVARRKDRLEQLQSQTRAKIRPLVADLSTNEGCSLLKAELEKVKPQVSVLVNAAGFGRFGAFTKIEISEQENMIALNVLALTSITYMVLPYMGRDSEIYQLGSLSSFQPVPYMTVYGASKAYVLSFSQALRAELAPSGIKVMAVCPGWIKTEFFNRAVSDNTIKYYNRYRQASDVVKLALVDMAKGKAVSILGHQERRQVRLVKHLPTKMVINTWLHQQQLDK